MTAAERRQLILTILRRTDRPISATALAEELSVSRQIIVGDVALLRAAGEDITATPRGYVMAAQAAGLRFQVACRHGAADIERELNLMVDHGCTVEDTVVEHSVYGQLVGRIDASSRYDVSEFVRKVLNYNAAPLSQLTDGIHLHTLRCPSEGAYLSLLEALRREGFLVE